MADMEKLGTIRLVRCTESKDTPSCSKVISKNDHVSDLLTTRWHCAKTLHVALGHASDDMYLV